jgi:hypothetical protein
MPQCPICSTEYIEEQTTPCSSCGWDLTSYPLTFKIPEEFVQKEQARISWAKEIWQEKQQLLAELSQFKEAFIQKEQARISWAKEIWQEKQQLLAELSQIQQVPQKLISLPYQSPLQVYPTPWLSGSLKIYEFSTGFINVQFSQTYRRWISEGVGEKIGQYNHPVPEKIKLAVNQDSFQINYQDYPQDNELSLIALDIDEYSILAVATGEIDDKNRRLVAYRYFWAEKSHPDVDGIGSLLLWWFTNSQPRFVMNEDYAKKQLPLGRLYTSKYFEQYSSEITEFLQQSSSLPCLLTISKKNAQILPSVTGCHCLALDLQSHQKQPISWAWNVHSLEKPNIFTVIFCTDDKAFERISRISQQ